MTDPARPRPHPLRQFPGLLLQLGVALFVGLFFALRTRLRHLRAMRHGLRALRAPPDPNVTLTPCGEGAFTVSCPWLGPVSAGAPTVVHLLGTGEHVYSPIPGLEEATRRVPELGRCRHVVIDTPSTAAAFLGPSEFASRSWPWVDSLVTATAGPVVLVGLSRGALLALELGSRLVSRRDRAIAVLALSPPLLADYRHPATVAGVAALEHVMVELCALEAHLPAALSRALDRVVTLWFVCLNAFILAELRMDGPLPMQLTARYLRERGGMQAALRATREFALLGHASDAELAHLVAGFCRVAKGHPTLRTHLMWGANDSWVPAERAHARAVDALAREDVDRARVSTSIVKGLNHGLLRQLDADRGQVIDTLAELCAQRARLAEESGRLTAEGR